MNTVNDLSHTQLREDSMDAIRPSQSQPSLNSLRSRHASRESAVREDMERVGGGGDEEAEGYATDTDSDLDHSPSQQPNGDGDVASSDSRPSSGADGPTRSRTATRKGRRGARSSHSVSFSRARSHQVEKRLTYDGREVTMVTLNTQTDWDWLEGAQKSGSKAKVILASEALAHSAHATHSAHRRSGSLKSILVKPESRETTSRPRTELGLSSAADTRTETDLTPFSLQPNDEYGIPLLEMSSTSDDSSDDEAPKKKRPQKASLPSVGPPQILKYVRESEMQEIVDPPVDPSIMLSDDTDFPVDEDGNPLGIFSGPCEFCGNNILPLPTIEMQHLQDPDKLYCCDDYREFIQFATSATLRMEEEAQKASKIINVKVHPHFGSKQARRAAKERAVERMRQRELQRRQQDALGSQANFYSSGASGGAPASGVPSRPPQMSLKPNTMGAGAGGGMFKDMARQMKTINYQLSSQRCLEEGWTLRPPSPLDMDEADLEVFVPEPLHPAMIAAGSVRDRVLIEKYYPSGDKFLTIFPDGTGNVFYPSGNLAIMVSSVTLGQYNYIVHDDTPSAPILAVFDPHGLASIYFANGNIHLYYDQVGGMELDVFGARRRRWMWKDHETHVHAPPFQPICVRLNRANSIRIMTQEAVALTFMSHKRSCRFSVGARLRLVAPQFLPPKEIDEHQLVISEQTARVESILNKVSVLLKFPKSPKLDKILPPLHITSKLQRAEKMRKDLTASVRNSSDGKGPAKRKNNLFPVVSVN